MNINHESMMALTADMPMKEIVINGEVYLQRYFAHKLVDGTQVWYHRFLRNDAERHLHNHPWAAKSRILVGNYSEERKKGGEIRLITYTPGRSNDIRVSTLHRIIRVEENTWTQMIVSPDRKTKWHFIEDDGSVTEMPTSPFEWHQDFRSRNQIEAIEV